MIVHRTPPPFRISPSRSTSQPFPFPPILSPITFPCLPLLRVSTAAARSDVAVDTFTEKSGYLFDLTSSEAGSLREYEVSKISSIYRRRPLTLLRRLFQIGSTFGLWIGLRYLDGLMDRSDQMFEEWQGKLEAMS